MKKEIKSLTGIRGVAAFSVMLYHLSQNPAFAAFKTPFFAKGYLCVDLFFVLSGFIIAFIYGEKFANGGNSAIYGQFLLNRIARVFPLNFVVTLVFAARMLVNVSDSTAYTLTVPDFVANIFMVQGWGFGAHALAGNSWSVSTEILAYLLFPLLVRVAFSRFWWLQAVIAVAVLGLVAASGLGVEGVMDVVRRDSFLPALRCVAGFSLGLVAFRLADYAIVRKWLASNQALVAVMVLQAILFLIPNADLAIVLTFPLLILVLYYDGSLSEKIFGNRIVYHLGIISYSIYLWHPLFRDIAARALGVAQKHGLIGFDILFVVAAIAMTWVASYLSYRFVESKSRDWIRHLSQVKRKKQVV